jgi:hypothetical protein
MKAQHFNCRITVPVPVREAFEKIGHVPEWWNTHFEGSASKPHDTYIAHWQDNFIKVEVTEMVPDQKIVWFVTDCYFTWLRDETEWKGTSMVFEISAQGNETQIHFTHVGLVPEIECYEICKAGWNAYIKKSLFQFLTQGKGLPLPGLR